MTCEEVWARLPGHVGDRALAGYGVFAIEEKQSGRFAGEVAPCDCAPGPRRRGDRAILPERSR